MTSFAPLPGAPRYLACSDGYVIGPSGKVLKPSRNYKGYLYVGVPGSTKRLNRLMALAFHGEPPFGKNQAAHWDGDKNNNRADNIYWASAQENTEDQRRHGTHIGKLSRTEGHTIRWALTNGWSNKELSELYEVTPMTITMVGQGKTHR